MPEVQASWRSGRPGASGDPTAWSAELPATLEGRATFVITALSPQTFDLVTNRVTEDASDCENEEETEASGGGADSGSADGQSRGEVDEEGSTIPIPDPPCGGCPRTSFYSDWNIPEGN